MTISLDDASIRGLHAAISQVVSFACEVEADAARFPSEWLFHRRWEKGKSRPKTHDGLGIDFITVGGRTSAVVPSLQKKSTIPFITTAAAMPSSASTSSIRPKVSKKVVDSSAKGKAATTRSRRAPVVKTPAASDTATTKPHEDLSCSELGKRRR